MWIKGLLLILDRTLSVGEESVLYDAQAEVAGANKAGLLSIQVRTGTWRPDSEEWDADLVPDTIAVLPEALNIRRG